MTSIAGPSLLQGVETALSASDLPRALGLARSALDQGFEHPLLFNLRAYWHEEEGRHELSLADLLRARELAPEDVSINNALGLAYARAGRNAEAVRAFDAAIAAAPVFGPAHFNRGWASEEAGELDDALHSYARAIELNPASADARARLALLASRLGEWKVARANSEQALAIDPRQPIAIRALASVELASHAPAAAESLLRGLLSDAAIPPSERADAEGLLGDTLDAQDRVDEAFRAYSARNNAVRAMVAPQFAGAGSQTMPDYLKWLLAYFERSDPARWRMAASPPSDGGPVSHVFMLGFPRSGTTLLEEVFAGEPAVITTQERDALADGVRDLMASPGDLDRLAILAVEDAERYRLAYWRRLSEHGIATEGKILIDKQPYNTVKLPLIFRLFPASRIVFSVRDPRDVVLSCFRRRFRMNPSNYELLTLEGAARFYDAVMRLAALYRAKLPLDLLQLRHEDLVDDFDRQTRAVSEFIGLPWNDRLGQFAERSGRRAIATPSSVQIARGLNREGIGQWRRYAAQLAPVMPVLSPWVEKFGYQPD